MNDFDDIRNSLNERKNEIDLMIELSKSCRVKEAVLIKSSIIIIAYNTIEGCFSKLNRVIFSFIYENNIPVEKLNSALQRIYFKYHHKIIINSSDSDILKDFYTKKSVTSITYDEICEKIRLFSGNLDAKAIREHSKNCIGINSLSMREDKNLLKVKHLRNQLAHGEITFEEATRDITIDEISIITNDCVKFMNRVITIYEDFFDKNIKILI